MAVKNTPQRIARRSGVKVPACLPGLRVPEGMSREEGRPVSRAKKTGSKSLNEQKLASGVSGFARNPGWLARFPRSSDSTNPAPGILRGRAARPRAGYRAHPLAHIPQKVVKISRNSLSINCLRRLSARATTSATRNTLRDASGNTTVPMSRPSATRPGGTRKARWRSSSAWRTPGNAATREAKLPTSSRRISWPTSPPSR